ncbi:MAG: hypothetical protein GPOALKHO_001324 [Sodalis sp.]|uniref:hypothetical protein n=1 Tax=Sodalis sp. (in: enterobacteria) TaxID=1898979 RepID=UPI0038739CB4|nr:MAG: hypothetical protein GPOALKHO_001324 [Sodalis sp.]
MPSCACLQGLLAVAQLEHVELAAVDNGLLIVLAPATAGEGSSPVAGFRCRLSDQPRRVPDSERLNASAASHPIIG